MKIKITQLRFIAIIAIALFSAQMAYAVVIAAGATQNQTDLAVGQKYGIGTTNQKLLKMIVTPTGIGDVITQFDLTLTGYSAISRVAILRNAYPDFDGGSTFGTVLNPATASISVTGSYTYATAGSQTFWVIIDVSPTASTGVTLDARCTLITDSPANLTPTAATNTKVVSTVDTPLSGTKTIKASGGDYTSLKTAAIDANILGIAPAGITYVLDDDATYTFGAADFADPSLYFRPQGATPGSITIKRSGTGTNKPIINIAGGAGAYEAAVGFFGYDNVTVDGIEIKNTNSANQKLEYGVHFYGTKTDGCQNNVVKNCSMTSLLGNAVRCISNATSAGAVNKNIKIFSNTVANGTATVSFSASPFEITGVSATYPDENYEVYDNTINGIFGNTEAAKITTTITVFTGILFTNCKDTKIHHNVLDGGTSTMHTNLSITGITARVGMSGYLECYANTVKNITNTGTGILNADLTVKNFASVGGIYLGCADTKVYNNVIANLKAESSLSIGLGLYGFYIVANDGVSSSYQIYNNSVYLSQAGTSNVGDFITTINMSGAPANVMSVTLNNNIFVNTCTTTNAKLYLMYSQGTSIQKASINTSSSNNLYYTTSATTFMSIGTSAYTTLAAYQTGLGGEVNTISEMPPFTSVSNLHIVNTSTSAVSNSGTPIALVSEDIDGNTRSLSSPDMGADEFELATAISQPNSNIQNVFLNMQNGDIVANLTELKGEVSISVYDTKGQNIKSILTVGGNYESLKLNKKGIYLVRIQNNNITSTNKVIL